MAWACLSLLQLSDCSDSRDSPPSRSTKRSWRRGGGVNGMLMSSLFSYGLFLSLGGDFLTIAVKGKIYKSIKKKLSLLQNSTEFSVAVIIMKMVLTCTHVLTKLESVKMSVLKLLHI